MSKYGYIKHSELSHHGILGQKWGVRRYQNADGSLTAEGKMHYSDGHTKKNKISSKKEAKSNSLKKLFYTDEAKKDFLDQMKEDVVGPWMVDDPEFVDMLIDDYIAYEDKFDSLTKQHRDQIFDDYKKMFYNLKRND